MATITMHKQYFFCDDIKRHILSFFKKPIELFMNTLNLKQLNFVYKRFIIFGSNSKWRNTSLSIVDRRRHIYKVLMYCYYRVRYMGYNPYDKFIFYFDACKRNDKNARFRGLKLV